MNYSMRNMLRRLRLSGLTETLEVRLHEASGNRLSHMEFLELILQDRRRLHKLPHVCSSK